MISVKRILLILLATLISCFVHAAPANFYSAKIEMKKHVYFDQNNAGTIYCGCDWKWAGASGGIIDQRSCGYVVASQPERAKRLEWEHIMPASNFGRARQCWQRGGRENCTATDPIFNQMEADMFNLAPAIGEVNADRSNYNFSQLTGSSRSYGACDFKVDFRARAAEPRDEVKGQVARVYFYMSDRYNIPLSRQQQQLFTAWNKLYPVSERERLLEQRTAKRMGHRNPFVTGAKTWTSGRQLDKQANPTVANQLQSNESTHQKIQLTENNIRLVRGNKRSNVYHLPESCPSYNQMAPHNIIEFSDEASAIASGYRKAGNCR